MHLFCHLICPELVFVTVVGGNAGLLRLHPLFWHLSCAPGLMPVNAYERNSVQAPAINLRWPADTDTNRHLAAAQCVTGKKGLTNLLALTESWAQADLQWHAEKDCGAVTMQCGMMQGLLVAMHAPTSHVW